MLYPSSPSCPVPAKVLCCTRSTECSNGTMNSHSLSREGKCKVWLNGLLWKYICFCPIHVKMFILPFCKKWYSCIPVLFLLSLVCFRCQVLLVLCKAYFDKYLRLCAKWVMCVASPSSRWNAVCEIGKNSYHKIFVVHQLIILNENKSNRW